MTDQDYWGYPIDLTQKIIILLKNRLMVYSQCSICTLQRIHELLCLLALRLKSNYDIKNCLN